MKAPNPGSEAALKLGCSCPVIDNHHGRGRPTHDGYLFIKDPACRIHEDRRCV